MAALTMTLDDGGDRETLADVLAFLDAFDESSESDTQSQAPQQQPHYEVNAERETSPPRLERRRHSRASASNRARVARYWRHKDELQSLRSTVEYLSNVLEAKKRGSLTLRSLHASPRSVAKQLSEAADMSWEQRARLERELRRRADETNARLRRLVACQMQWSNMLNSTLQTAWWSTWQEYVSCPFKACGPSGQPEQLGWETVRAARAAAATASNSWTTSFPIPAGDPQHIGGLWWATVQKLSLITGPDGNKFLVDHTNGVRVTRTTSWSVRDDHNQEIPFTGQVAFEVSKSDTHWALVATADVFDASGSKLLFQTIAARLVTLVETGAGQVCEFHAHYSVDYPTDASHFGEASTLEKEAIGVQIGVKTWAGVMRQKDQHMRALFGDRPARTAM